MPTKMDYEAVLREAFAAAELAKTTPERPLCCGRIYVCLVGKAHARGVAKAAKAMRKIFYAKGPHGMTNTLYVSYDNADGRGLAAGTAVARVLAAAGIECYREEQED